MCHTVSEVVTFTSHNLDSNPGCRGEFKVEIALYHFASYNPLTSCGLSDLKNGQKYNLEFPYRSTMQPVKKVGESLTNLCSSTSQIKLNALKSSSIIYFK